MLRIDRVELEDFGPFKGRQAINLPPAAGLVVVYGENMRGKTSLLNAIRFALFGKVLGRASQEGSLHRIGNWEQAAAGKYGFEVVLDLQADGRRYRLTRSCRPLAGKEPAQDHDYQTEFFLRRDGEVLGPGEAKSELERIMPEQIARFFLFDGELLQEYEDLLRNENDMGRQISEAIERILGVPALTRSRATLTKLRNIYDKMEAKTAQADLMTRELGNHMDDLHGERQVLHDGLSQMRDDLSQLRVNKAALDSELRRSDRFAAMMEKRDLLRSAIELLDEQIEARHADIAAEMHSAWKLFVASRAVSLIRDLRDREQVLQLRKMRHEVVRTSSVRGSTSDQCPTCLQPLNDEVLARMTAAAAGEAVELAEVERELRDIQRRLGALEDAARAPSDAGLRMLWNDLHHLEA